MTVEMPKGQKIDQRGKEENPAAKAERTEKNAKRNSQNHGERKVSSMKKRRARRGEQR